MTEIWDPNSLADFEALRERYADLFGRAAAVYGLNPLLGRLYGALFLSSEALTLDELAKQVGAAKSTVSVAMRSLETYRIVRRQWRKGDRRDFFLARADFPEMLRDWYRLFFQHELHYAEQANATARQALATSAGQPGWPSSAQRDVLLDRLDRLDKLMAAFRIWFDQFLDLVVAPAPRPAEVIPIQIEGAPIEEAGQGEAHRGTESGVAR